MKKRNWNKVHNYLVYVYPFLMISVGCMYFGWLISTKGSGYLYYLQYASSLVTAMVGGSVIDDRLKKVTKKGANE